MARAAARPGLFEFGLSFTLLGQTETGSLSQSLTRMGHTADQLSVMSAEQADKEQATFEARLAEYTALVAGAKNALAKRVEKRTAMEAAKAELEVHASWPRGGKNAPSLRVVLAVDKSSRPFSPRTHSTFHQALIDRRPIATQVRRAAHSKLLGSGKVNEARGAEEKVRRRQRKPLVLARGG